MPESPDVFALYRSALDALGQGQLAEARSRLQDVLEQPAPPVAGRFLPDLTSYLSQITRPRGAEVSWNLDPHAAARWLLCQISWELGETEAALTSLQQQLDGNPTAIGYHLFARWLLELARPDAAAAALGQALQQDPAYLPAYEDLATLANANGASDLAFRVIQQALSLELSPRLFQELLLACSREDYVPMRSLFLELCVRYITAETRLLLQPLLQRLYEEGDFHHAAFLGFHLHAAFPLERQILSLYVLASLKLGQFVPALQALLQAGDSHFRQGEHWFKLGVAYSLWRMPDFARHALLRAQALTPALAPESASWLQQLPAPAQLDSLLGQILRQIMVEPAFATALQEQPEATLSAWGLPLSPELLAAVARIGTAETGGQTQ